MSTTEDQAVYDALQLIALVRDLDQPGIAAFLHETSRPSLNAAVVALAAMVPDDQTPDTLLSWVRPARPSHTPRPRPRVHGSHAGFNAHRAHNEHPCEPCWTAERVYQREQKRLQRRRLSTDARGIVRDRADADRMADAS